MSTATVFSGWLSYRESPISPISPITKEETMGRGRAKAKATKVARELKYTSIGGDLDALRAELHSEREDTVPTSYIQADEGELGDTSA